MTASKPTNYPVAHVVLPPQGDHPRLVFPIYPGKNVFGRCQEIARISILPHEYISNEHLSIEADGDEFWLEDLTSTNGTYFANPLETSMCNRLKPHRYYQLTNGKIFYIGKTEAVFEILKCSQEKEKATRDYDTTIMMGSAAKGIIDATIAENENRAESPSELKSEPKNDKFVGLVTADGAPESSFLLNKDRFHNILEGSGQENDDENDTQMNTVDLLGEMADNEHKVFEHEGVHSSSLETADNIVLAQNNVTADRTFVYETNLESPVLPSGCGVLGKTLTKSESLLLSSPIRAEDNAPVYSSNNTLPSKPNHELNMAHEAGQTSVSTTQDTSTPPASSHSQERPNPKKRKIVKSKAATNKSKGMQSEQNDELDDTAAYQPPKNKAAARKKGKTAAEIVCGDIDAQVVENPSPAAYNKENFDENTGKDEISIMLTGLDDKYEKKVKKLGVKVAYGWKDCTHLVTDKIRRTTKFLCALSSGKCIISSAWIDASTKAKRLLDPMDFPIKDGPSEKKWCMKLEQALNLVRQRGASKLMMGYEFLITPSVVPDFEDLKEIIEACGGKVLADLPYQGGDQIWIITCADDKFLWKEYAQYEDCLLDPEFVLSAALKQELFFDANRLRVKQRR